MIKDASYKQAPIPTPVVSNFDEEQTTTLTTALLENIIITQGKRNLESFNESRALKRSTTAKNEKPKSGSKSLAENIFEENLINSDDSFAPLPRKPTKLKTAKKQKVSAPTAKANVRDKFVDFDEKL